MSYHDSVETLAVVACIWAAISLGFAIPTGISASRRGMNPFGWGILTFFTHMAGLVLFLLFLKPKRDEVTCAACGSSIPKDHIYCPFCGHTDRETAASLERGNEE